MIRIFVLAAVVVVQFASSAGRSTGTDGRSAADLNRDQRSKPEAVLPLLALQSGDRVVDLFAGGGYYSELLADLVGPQGQVLLHNNEGFRLWGVNELKARFDGRSLPGVVLHDRELADLDLGIENLDAALMVMALHDLYVIPKKYDGKRYVAVGPPADAQALLRQVYQALKPAGRLVVVDHAGDTAMAMEAVLELHRIPESFARREIESAGFRYVGFTDALRNSADDRSMIVFDSDVKGLTDRFVLAFEKPPN